MQTNVALKFSPIFSDEKKLEVSLTDREAIIKLSTWTEDLGWCGQKTLSLDAEMLDDLHRVIASARYKLKSKKTENQLENQTTNVLTFPKSS